MGRRGIGGMLVDGGSRASAKIFLSRCKLWHSCSVLQPLRDHPRKMARRERGAHANSGICRICLFLVGLRRAFLMKNMEIGNCKL